MPPEGIPITDPRFADIVKLGRLPRNVFNVLSYGAAANGVTDDAPAIQRTIVAAEKAGSGTVYFPTGDYLIKSALQVQSARIHLRGDGFKSRIMRAGATGNAIEIDGHGACSVSRLRIERETQGTSGIGIYVNSVNGVWIADVEVLLFYEGILLRSASSAHVSRVQVANTSAGGHSVTIDGGNEYDLSDIQIATANAAGGFLIQSSTAALEGVRLGDFTIIGGGTIGIRIVAANYTLGFVEIVNGVIGEQTNEALSVETAGPGCNDLSVANVAYLNSSSPSGSIWVKGSVARVRVVNCSLFSNGGPGIRFDGSDCSAVGCTVISNGSGGTFSGIILGSTSVGSRVVGCRVGGNTNYGVEVEPSATNYIVVACDLGSNTVGALSDNGTGAKVVRHNLGHITENRGGATIGAASTSVVVTHGLSVQPVTENISLQILGRPTNDIGFLYITNITATQFTINCWAAPGGAGLNVGWQVHVI